MTYTPPAEYPFEDLPSTDTPVYASTLDGFIEGLVDLHGNPLVNTDTTGAAIGQVVAVTEVGPLVFETVGLDDLIDTTPIVAADFGLVAPKGCRVYANATGQTVTSGSYPTYLNVNATEYNDDVGLFTVDHATDRITVNANGLYLISWEVEYIAATSGIRDAYLTKNGGNALRAAGGVAATDLRAYRSCPLRLVTGDYIKIITYVEGATVSIRSTDPFQSGFELVRIGL